MSSSMKWAMLFAAVTVSVPLAASAEDYRYPQRYEDPRDYRRDDRYDDRYDYDDRSYGRDDHELHDEVHDALVQALGQVGNRIGVSVHHGRVVLSGSVPDSRTRRIAHDVAHDVPGVRSVTMSRLYAGYRRRY